MSLENSIVASQSIKKGDKLSSKNITTKRPGDGISPMEWNRVVGVAASKNYDEDEMIQEQEKI